MSINLASPSPEVRTLIDELLSEQRDLSAVGKFSRLHASIETEEVNSRYRDLIPLSKPRPGEQYGFEVDLDRCSGCKGCVTACHALNGLDDSESWRDVGILFGKVQVPISTDPQAGNRVVAWQQTVTTACHHCVEPACLLGCPVLAYDKDPITGIVRHLDDQCIGCSYCILKCPYEVPRFSRERGIVRKCDMCHGRLAEGEAPACVQACPNEAIRITTVETAQVAREARRSPSEPWLADAPDPAISLPTTRYRSSKIQPQLFAADHYRNQPAQAHWPLIVMLVLTQVGMGMILASAAAAQAPVQARWGVQPGYFSSGASVGGAGLVLFFLGLGASVLHLGQPRKAWRVWLGWRTSWLSREAIVLNAVAGIGLTAAAVLYGDLGQRLNLAAHRQELLHRGTSAGLALLIVLAVLAQSMVYVDTHRLYWSWWRTAPRFFGTVAITGALALAVMTGSSAIAGIVSGLLILKLAVEINLLKHGITDELQRHELRRSAALVTGPLRPVLGFRLVSAALSLGALLFGAAAGFAAPYVMVWAAGFFFSGEIFERWLFFAGASPDKMPGIL